MFKENRNKKLRSWQNRILVTRDESFLLMFDAASVWFTFKLVFLYFDERFQRIDLLKDTKMIDTLKDYNL